MVEYTVEEDKRRQCQGSKLKAVHVTPMRSVLKQPPPDARTDPGALGSVGDGWQEIQDTKNGRKYWINYEDKRISYIPPQSMAKELILNSLVSSEAAQQVCLYTYIHTHAHTHARAHTQTHTHTHTHTNAVAAGLIRALEGSCRARSGGGSGGSVE